MDPDAVLDRARELAAGREPDCDSTDELVAAAGGDRRAVEAARDAMAVRLHEAVDDFEATAVLQLLNRALGEMPRQDPLDWRVRWSRRFSKP